MTKRRIFKKNVFSTEVMRRKVLIFILLHSGNSRLLFGITDNFKDILSFLRFKTINLTESVKKIKRRLNDVWKWDIITAKNELFKMSEKTAIVTLKVHYGDRERLNMFR